MDIRGEIGICQDARKHKEREAEICPQWMGVLLFMVPRVFGSHHHPALVRQIEARPNFWASLAIIKLMLFGCIHMAFAADESLTVANQLKPSSPYTIEFSLKSQWLDAKGDIRDTEQIDVQVAQTKDAVVIQPWLENGGTNIGFMTWATSPYRAGEWIVGALSVNLTSKITLVAIDTHPTAHTLDLFPALGRILYLAHDHPSLAGISEDELLYIGPESCFYTPQELSLRTTSHPSQKNNLLDSIVCMSPDYCYLGGLKKHFSGPPFERKLWELKISEYTNLNGVNLAARFTYTRYQDANLRIEKDSNAKIVYCEGRLLSVSDYATVDIKSRLDNQLQVIDFRPFQELGSKPARYSTNAGQWPTIGSKDYLIMIDKSKIKIAAYSNARQSLSNSGHATAFFFLFLFTTLIPVGLIIAWSSKRRFPGK